MYFISPPSPNIFLMCGLYDEHEFRGIGEKDGKLCIYRKSIFDLGDWKEFYLTDINVVKAECCDTGIHVATGLFNRKLWFAVREDKFTRIFSLNTDALEFTRYDMIQEEDNSLLHNLNLCCKCLSPIVRCIDSRNSDILSLHIDPQKYQHDVGIVRILVTINQSGECTMRKNSFELVSRPISSNILINASGEVLSVIEKAKLASENERIAMLSIQSEGFQINCSTTTDTGCEVDGLWHELAFSSANGLCLTRRQKGDKVLLQILYATYSVATSSLAFNYIDYCTVDANFPSLESLHFYVTFRHIDEEYDSKRGNKICFGSTKTYVSSYIYFQLADGSTVTIPLEVLSLSQLSYIALSRILQPPQQQQCPLPVVKISLMDYFFQRIRNLCGESKKEEDVSTKGFFHQEVDDDEVWMSQEFIKKKIGWPKILSLIKAPNLPFKSE